MDSEHKRCLDISEKADPFDLNHLGPPYGFGRHEAALSLHEVEGFFRVRPDVSTTHSTNPYTEPLGLLGGLCL